MKNEIKTLTPKDNKKSLVEVTTNDSTPIDEGLSRSELERLLQERIEDLEEYKEAFEELQEDA